jgi:hypothetical protein
VRRTVAHTGDAPLEGAARRVTLGLTPFLDCVDAHPPLNAVAQR